MKVLKPTHNTVIVSVDSNARLAIAPSEAIELRDLLLREFPVPLNEHERQRLAEMNVELFSRVEKILRRERIATAVLAGFAANQVCDPMEPSLAELEAAEAEAARIYAAKPNVATAIVWADALIAALDKEA